MRSLLDAGALAKAPTTSDVDASSCPRVEMGNGSMEISLDHLGDLKGELLARGFCVVRSVLVPRDVAAIKQRVRYVAAHEAFYRRLGVFFVPSPGEVAGGREPLQRFEQIGNLPFLDAECRRHLLLQPRFARLVEAVLGADFNVVNAGFFLKPAGGGAEIPWHQDAATWGVPVGAWAPADAPLIFDYWMAIDDADRDNGCFEILPGSHRRGVLAHARRGRLLAEADPTAFGFDPAQRLAIPAAAGDVVIYHQDMFHRSDRNLSSRPRLAAAGTFAALAEMPRLRALLPGLSTLERCPALRAGRPVELSNPLPPMVSRTALWRWRLRRPMERALRARCRFTLDIAE